ncbi:hypothetical protein PABG_00717 [Paracoccidioides brasiliensis Pb03]|nr:hypothetical protein PABG_00717 [Paracoccidioides brasiliensis Pb03]
MKNSRRIAVDCNRGAISISLRQMWMQIMHPPFAESLEFAGKQLDIRLREEQQATGLCAFVYALQSGGKRESLMISVTSLSPGHRSVHSRGLAKSLVLRLLPALGPVQY